MSTANDPAVAWRLVVVVAVHLELPGDHPEVELRENDPPGRTLRIPVGLAEGNAIARALKSLPTPRPLTHELFASALAQHEVRIEAVRIVDRQGGNYIGELDTIGPRGRRLISCRPSDALALALRQSLPTPILVAEQLLGTV